LGWSGGTASNKEQQDNHNYPVTTFDSTFSSRKPFALKEWETEFLTPLTIGEFEGLFGDLLLCYSQS
jgi:hypothetical protein